MQSDPYSYELPVERIAQRPVHPYDAARLLVVDRAAAGLTDSRFTQIGDFLRPRDLLIFNSSRVMPARLFGELEKTHAKIELLLLEELAPGTWECLARPLKRLQVGKELWFSEGLQARVQAITDSARVQLEFRGPTGQPATAAEIEAQACMPIPPYIRDGRADQQDRLDYQACFAQESALLPGASVAAPTAGLHFTPQLRAALVKQGVQLRELTLHVGAASFQPLLRKGGTLTEPGEERFFVPPELLTASAQCRAEGGRVIAVGTTVARALETCYAQSSSSQSCCPQAMPSDADASGKDLALVGAASRTRLFIRPGFCFRGIDGLITNFHQPNTTHLLLVEALLGRALLEQAYQHALRGTYRFLSYGDGMLIC